MERLSISGWVSLAVSFLVIPSFVSQSLSLLCREQEPHPTTNTQTAVPGNGANCTFRNTLCTYTQGCRDPEMSNWTATDGAAVAQQLRAGSGSNSFSVLESPLLSLDHVSCVEFMYTNHRPSDLDLFRTVNGTDSLLFQGPHRENSNGATVFKTVPRDTSILKFRAYGGGAGAAFPPVSLHYVIIHAGNCTGPACGFTTSEMCGWKNTNWEHISPDHVEMRGNARSGTLTTGLVKATTGLCVEFSYCMDSRNDTLSVSVQYLNGLERPVWTAGTTTQSWSKELIHIQSAMAFRLVFLAVRCHSSQSRIAIDDVTSANCERRSSGASTHVSLYEKCSATTTTVPTESTTMSASFLPTTIPMSTTTMSGSPSAMNPISTNTSPVTERNDADEDSSTGAIAGSVVASIVLIVLVVIVIWLWRKRKHKRGDSEEKNNVKGPSIQAHQESSSNVKDPARTIPAFIKPSHPADGDYSEVRDMLHNNTADPYEFAEPIPREEADLGDTDEYNRLGVHGTRKKDASNPYELARAFPAENTADVNVSDEYHHLNRQGVESKETEGSTTTEKRGEYSHLGQHSEKKGSGDVYSVAQKNRKGVNTANQAGDEYNKINLKEQGYRKQRGETPDVYNHLGGVNSPDKAQPGLVREDEYNRINLKEKGPQQRGATTDVYNRLGGDVTPSGACDNAERDKGPDQGTENYNTLDFDRGDEQTGGSGNAGKKTRQGVQTYDHVQDDFQETYSKPQRDKKERVIDSNYDHVTPS